MYERIVAYVNSNYWALERSRFETMLAVLRLRSDGFAFSPEEIRARIEAAGGRAEGPVERFWCLESDDWLAATETRVPGRQTVAVIGAYGMLSHRAGSMNEMSGGTSTERLASAVRSAAADASVKGIVFDINSPGGTVDGVTELAGEIRAARNRKPVEAVANAHALSGGYWIGSAASHLTAIPSALLGAIGVYGTHMDDSKAREMRGERLEIITDDVLSKHKAEGVAGPLPPEGHDHVRSIANSYANMFGRDVAQGRGVSIDVVRRDFGEGRSVPAKAALVAKMIDGIGSLEDAVRRVARGATPSAEDRRSGGPAPEPTSASAPATSAPDAEITAEQIEAADRLFAR